MEGTRVTVLWLDNKNIMIQEYMKAAMRHAKYEVLPEDQSYYGEIPECNGVWANADNWEDCRQELQEVLEEWIFLRLRKDLSIPKIDGVMLELHEVA